MKIGQNTAVSAAALFGNEEDGGIRVATAEKKSAAQQTSNGKSGEANGNVSASSLHLGDSSVEARKQLARKQAMKVVSDAFDREKCMDRSLQEIRDNLARLNEELGTSKQTVNENNEKLAVLRAEYGIDEGSEEEQGLVAAARKANSKDGMTSDEYNQLSEYQQRALYYMSSNQELARTIAEDEALLAANVQSATDLGIERLKDHSMIDAQKAADEMMEAADKEAITALTAEAMEHIDEKAEEEKEAAEKKAEEEKEAKKEELKKEENQAQVDELNARIRAHSEAEAAEAAARGRAARQERENMGAVDATDAAVTFDAQGIDTHAVDSTVEGEVRNILNKLSLLSEDIKGARVDDVL